MKSKVKLQQIFAFDIQSYQLPGLHKVKNKIQVGTPLHFQIRNDAETILLFGRLPVCILPPAASALVARMLQRDFQFRSKVVRIDPATDTIIAGIWIAYIEGELE